MFTLQCNDALQWIEPTMLAVRYSGETVAGHSMSVTDLAPALMGLSDALTRYGEITAPLVDVDVRFAAMNAESLEVILQLSGAVAHFAQEIGPSSTAGIIDGVLDVIAILNARVHETGNIKPLAHEIIQRGDTDVDVKIGQVQLTINRKAYAASCDRQLINSLGAASKPASMAGYDPVCLIQMETQRSETVDADTSVAMQEFGVAERPVEPSIEETVLQIDTIQTRSNKWKFQKDGEAFWCEIRDERFLKRWRDRQVTFINGDLLKVNLETEQYMCDGRLETGRRRIVKVIEHMPLETQPAFDI